MNISGGGGNTQPTIRTVHFLQTGYTFGKNSKMEPVQPAAFTYKGFEALKRPFYTVLILVQLFHYYSSHAKCNILNILFGR
jgi:hypothetical protein